MPTRDYLAEELEDLRVEVQRLRSRLEAGADRDSAGAGS
jgi:hypothetical protein